MQAIQILSGTRAALRVAVAAGPPDGYAGVVGPATGEAAVATPYNDSLWRSYLGWNINGYRGGMYYAEYNVATDGSQRRELDIFIKVTSTVTLYFILDNPNGDGGTGSLEIGGMTVGFDAGSGNSGDIASVSLVVEAGSYTAIAHKLLRRSLYLQGLTITAN